MKRRRIGVATGGLLVVGALAAVPLSGYDLSRIRFDGSPPSAERVLRIEIPWRAKQIKEQFAELTPYGVTFLMPQGRWREHVTSYVDEDRLSFTAFGADANRPSECSETTTGRYRGTQAFIKTTAITPQGFTAYRTVSVVEDCQPGWAYVSWYIPEPRTDGHP